MTPTTLVNQKHLALSFALDDGDGTATYMTLPIRPEELTRTEPSRVNAVNSLGGAWVDSFGRGLTTLTISGHTGWGNNGGGSGISHFNVLRDEFIKLWHTLRRQRSDRGEDPNAVRLIFIDALNGPYVADIVPMTFTLRRSKSHPLLMMYNIVFTVTKDKAENPYPELLDEQKPNDRTKAAASIKESMLGLEALQGGLGELLESIGEVGTNITSFVNNVLQPAMAAAQEVIDTANLAKSVISSAGNIIIQNAASITAAGNKMFEAIGSVVSLPNYAKAELLKVKGAISNMSCSLSNGFAAAFTPINYAALYGGSNCSTTSPDGRAASETTKSGASAFASVIDSTVHKILISPSAAAALADMQALDVATSVDQQKLAATIAAISAGVSFG